MALSVWEYIRRRTTDAILAGCRDAFEVLERQDQAAAMWGAAKALRQQLNEALGGNGHANGANNSPPPQNHAAPAPQRPPAPPATPATAAPTINHTPAAVSAVPQNPERRKVGRPRKEVFG